MKLSLLSPVLFALAASIAAAQNPAPDTVKPPAAETAPAEKEHPWTITQVNGQDYVTIDDVAAYYRFQKPEADSTGIVLRSPRLVMTLKADSDEVRINNVRLKLLLPLTGKDGTVLLSRRDLSLILDPVIRPRSLKETTPFNTVLLDVRGPADTTDRTDLLNALKTALEAGGCRTIAVTRDAEGKTLQPDSAVTAEALLLTVNLERNASGKKEDLFTFVPDIDVATPETGTRNHINQALGVSVHAQLLYQTRLPDHALQRKADPLIASLTIPAVTVDLKCPAAPPASFARAIAQGILTCRKGLWPAAGRPAPVPALPRRRRDIPEIDLKPAPAQQAK